LKIKLKDIRCFNYVNKLLLLLQQMNRTWNIINCFRETKTMFAIQPSKFPWRNSHFQNNSRKHFTRYTSVFLILSNASICPSTTKIRPKITLYALSTSYETR